MAHWRAMMPMMLSHKSNGLRKIHRHYGQPRLHCLPSSNNTPVSGSVDEVIGPISYHFGNVR
jgi:hypothetical protein